MPVRYRAESGATVIISGGRVISGWTEDAEHAGVWKARAGAPETADQQSARFNQLWVNGKRALRARAPNYWEFATVKSVAEEQAGSRFKHVFKVVPESLASLRGIDEAALRQVQMVIYHKWDTTREPVDSVSVDDGTLVTLGTKMQSWNGMDKDSLFFLENAMGALDAPGEWFLDNKGWLYYRPRPGEDMKRAEVIAPVADAFLSFQGERGKTCGMGPTYPVRRPQVSLRGASDSE